ncbi:hypothetical protein T06_8701, partial [Trichinella sp. T6]
LAAPSRGQKGFLLRPDLSAINERSKDPNHDHLIGCRRGCRSAPEIASAPAASGLPIGGSRRIDRGPADLDSIYMARKHAADIHRQNRDLYLNLIASSLASNPWFCNTGCQYCRYSEESTARSVPLAESENQKTSAKESAIFKSFWTLSAAHAVEDTSDPPLIIQSTYFVAGRTNVWSIRT